MKVWDPSYADTWVKNVRREVKESGVWDGVMADNDMSTLRYYNGAVLGGSKTHSDSDARLRAGLASLVRKAGAALHADGKLFIPNVSEGRLNLPRWRAAARYGGAMDEQFAHWGTDASTGFVMDWGPTGWIGQTQELSTPLSLLVTHGRRDDTTAFRFGYGSALVRAQGRVAWTSAGDGSYVDPQWFAWQSLKLGEPTSNGTREGRGLWSRTFVNGIVVVNPTQRRLSAKIGMGYCSDNHQISGATVTIPSHDARLLIRRPTAGAC